jgi:hypothetical protein
LFFDVALWRRSPQRLTMTIVTSQVDLPGTTDARVLPLARISSCPNQYSAANSAILGILLENHLFLYFQDSCSIL